MYKVLVVDDEALERVALKRIIEKRYPEQCAVTVAVNGQEALLLCEKLRVDIVLMDIEMPGTNGLEAARIIKQMLPRCHVLILTAYQRFQYVQAAIEIGVEEYLLKPVSDHKLFQKMEKIMAQIAENQNNLERRHQLDQLAKEQFVLSVISGYSNEASLKNQLRDLGIFFSYGFFMIVKGEKTRSAEKLAQMADPFFSTFEGGSCLTFEYDELLLVAVIMLKTYEDAEWMENQAAQLFSQVMDEHQERFMIGIGDAALTLPEMRLSYEAAREAVVRTSAATPIAVGGKQSVQTGEGLEDRLYHLLLDKDLDGAIRLTDITLDVLAFGPSHTTEAATVLERLLNGVAKRLAEDMRSSAASPADFSLSSLQSSSKMEWLMALRTFFLKWIEAAEDQQGPHVRMVKQEIERYLQQNYNKDLSIGQVARDMHYSEPYFSKLFTRCFQRNFISYLTELRLKMARDMLLDPVTSVKEIGVAVGYEDPNYFAKVFRKAYGMSPSEYRRKRATRKDGCV